MIKPHYKPYYLANKGGKQQLFSLSKSGTLSEAI